MQHVRQVILDTETTGFKPEEGHRVIEFAGLEMIDRKLTGNKLQLYINPQRLIDAGAMKVHGITDEYVADKPVFAEVVDEIIEFINGSELIIHNAKFDMGFLNHHFNQIGKSNGRIKSADSYIKGVIDTLAIARQKFPGGKNSLDALCDRFKVDRSIRDYHGALVDCKLLADVYLALTREQINLLEADAVNKVQQQDFSFTKIDTAGLRLKIVHPSLEEDNEHIKYLHELDKASHGKSSWFNIIKNSLHE